MITVNALVRNEERFVAAAIRSVLASRAVERVLVWDTGSTDATVQKIRSIRDKRVEFSQKGRVDRGGLVRLRNEQLAATQTPWFVLVDGDEIWPQQQLSRLVEQMRRARRQTVALVCRTRNVVGDLTHYLPEEAGRYRIGPWSGHLNIRAVRNAQGLSVQGVYPDEWYQLQGRKIQELVDRLELVEAWYLHATHLKRAGSWWEELTTLGRWQKHRWFLGLRGIRLLAMSPDELPHVLRERGR